MASLRDRGNTFTNTQQKHNFSGKHELYGLKIGVSVSPEDRMVDMSTYQPGFVSDMTIFRSRNDIHAQAMTKTPDEVAANDNVHPKKKPVQGAWPQ
ncbi:hypothetical protein H310_09389 [Aphanomyces invadans]|uniref:DDE Tnp4 domain-containing protein n=1 Tax=Aphanomyces invadans TaxID=157072 RepID=A0A024TTJ3_9STRA|nr:hypothetical protein H310_09389 [Aphanomyces invadans]ETV97460.1 hypothetical protein H310_09389 [Aphanomyces invadans]|eukprot:XP_008873669.1 hypothetical protein H310_09389 [Aphanomyces invadans]